MEEEFGRNLGGIWEASGRHLGGIWEAPRGTPGGTQEAPRAPQEARGVLEAKCVKTYVFF